MNKVCCTHLALQLCLKDDGLVWIGWGVTRLQSVVPQTEFRLGTFRHSPRNSVPLAVFETNFECPNVLEK